jgi:glycolate oxidase FAD binding subunit
MTLRPSSVDQLAASIVAHPRLRVRGGGTKPALSSPAEGEVVIDTRGLAGILEHRPEECTFTALAGTPIAQIERALAPHGQYLPFDPPLAHAGATLGGTVAAGVNGSCRYRFGGIRDFIIGTRMVDGRGQVIASGGKVVKNAAGFLLHQALVGSCGSLGVIVEITCKVFPAPEAHATLRVDTPDVAAATALVAAIQRARFDLEAIDLEAPGTVWVRLGGFREAMPPRVVALQQALGPETQTIAGDDEEAVWRGTRAFAWLPDGWTLVRVPTTLPVVASLDATLGRHGARRRYAVAGNVALIGWPGPLDDLDTLLSGVRLGGQVLFGPGGRPFIGTARDNEFGARVKAVLDPDGRF